MAWRSPGAARAAAARRRWAGPRPVPDVLVRLVSRLLVAQAGATTAIGLAYSRRTMPWVMLTIIAAVAVCGLAVLVRSGGQGAWLAAICLESGLAAVGLFSFAYAGYAGGTLLSLVTLGTLLHPAVARAFAAQPRSGRGTALANSGSDALRDPAVG